MSERQPTLEEVRASLEVDSDRLNYEDVARGPVVVRVVMPVKVHDKKQQWILKIDGNRQPYHPCKTMRRVITAAWSMNPEKWIGQSMELIGDPTVKYKGKVMGGIRISKMTQITEPIEVLVTVRQGVREPYRVEPLVVTQQQPEDRIAAFREWLTGMGRAEAAAEFIGKSLDDATRDDWNAILNWTKVVTQPSPPTPQETAADQLPTDPATGDEQPWEGADEKGDSAAFERDRKAAEAQREMFAKAPTQAEAPDSA